ncbi:MAG: tRNA lysidine(34) synthetase TilS [Lachnospiraceae bacterium]|nr:tRNA lysidine(34) synthetase TilS [Lachnospiraceae bacterium]
MITAEKIQEVMQRHHMTEKGDRVMIGVSGGADSMCLLFLMSALRDRMGMELEAVHVHHGIRGESADGDMEFVEEQCRKLQIPCKTVRLDIPALAEKEGLSEEEAGRIERYRIFNETKADRIAVAHHLEDSAETTLFNLFRGTGLKGLGGIRPVSGNIIRPLIYCTRSGIEEYCRENGIAYREDETNRDTDLSRNRIRLNILPEAAKINPASVKHIAEASEKIRDAFEYMDSEGDRVFSEAADISGMPDRLVLDISRAAAIPGVIRSLVLKKCIVRIAGKEKDIGSAHVQDLQELMLGGSGKELNLPYGVTARKSFDHLILSKGKGEDTEKTKEEIPFIVGEDGSETVLMLPDGRRVTGVLTDKPDNIPVLGYTKWLDYDKIKDTAVWRTRRAGDRISIQGGSRKIKELFIEKKIPAEERDDIYYLASGGNVIWVPGLRIGNDYKITENTQRALKVTISNQTERNRGNG